MIWLLIIILGLQLCQLLFGAVISEHLADIKLKLEERHRGNQ